MYFLYNFFANKIKKSGEYNTRKSNEATILWLYEHIYDEIHVKQNIFLIIRNLRPTGLC